MTLCWQGFKQLLYSSHGRDNNKEAVAVNLRNLWRFSQTNSRNVVNAEHDAQWRGRGHQRLPDLSGLYMHFRFIVLLVTALRSSQYLLYLACFQIPNTIGQIWTFIDLDITSLVNCWSKQTYFQLVVKRTSLFVSLYTPLIWDLPLNVCKSPVCFSASTCAPMLSATFCSIAWTICQMLLDF